MGLLDAYQDSTDTALRVMASRPLEPDAPTPKRSAWTTPFRAVAAGAAEVAGNVMDTAGAFGQVSAAAGGLTPGFDPDAAKNRNATVDAYDKLKTEGINWRTDEAQQAYKFGADLRPDPLTAGTAENIVFGLTKGLTKAIGAAATLGPVGGAMAFGGSEGLTTAEDLANQGVDQETRTKVGAVTGVMSAAGVALPVAGKTLAQTAGLVLVGGPFSFMAQQQATRSILENANYGEIAKQYDPLDPVGLTVATLLPAGFAAYAKRGGFGAKPKPDVAPVSEAAPDSNVIAATPEAIDAAMVQNLTVGRDVHQDTPQAKIAAEIWRGPVTENPNFKTWFGDSKVTQEDGSPMVVYHGTPDGGFQYFDQYKEGANTGSADAQHGLGGFYFSDSPDIANTYARTHEVEFADVAERELGITPANTAIGPSIYPVYLAMRRPLAIDGIVTRKVVDRAKQNGNDGIIARIGGNSEYVVFSSEQIKSAIGNSGKFDPNSPSLTDPIANDLTATKPVAEVQTPDAYAARVDAIAKEQPDLIARLDEAGQPVKLADELAAIKKQAQEGTDTDFGALDAPLLKTAIECALSLGAA